MPTLIENMPLPNSEFLIVANGPFIVKEIITELSKGKTIIALDGAGFKLARIGLKPHYVLGDFDSVQEAQQNIWGITNTFDDIDEHTSPYVGNYGVTIVPAKNQDLSDLDKAIAFCNKKSATSIHIVCATGGRMDHHEHNIRALRRNYRPSRPIYLYTEEQVLIFAKDEKVMLNGYTGDKCGIMSYPKGTFQSSGLEYEAQEPYSLIFAESDSACNSLKCDNATVTIEGEALIIMPAQLASQRAFMQKNEVEQCRARLVDADRKLVEISVEELEQMKEIRKALKLFFQYKKNYPSLKDTYYVSQPKEHLTHGNSKLLISCSPDKFRRFSFFRSCLNEQISQDQMKAKFMSLYGQICANEKLSAAFASKTFFFDLDGTLCNTEDINVKSHLATLKHLKDKYAFKYGVPEPEKLEDLVRGLPVRDAISAVVQNFSEIASIRHEYETMHVQQYESIRKMETTSYLIKSTSELIKSLSITKHPVCIVSGSLIHEIERAIEELGLKKKQVSYIGLENYQVSKPDPQPYLQAAELMNVEINHNCIVFEDSLYGVRSAKAAGMFVIALSTPKTQAALLQSGADRVIDIRDITLDKLATIICSEDEKPQCTTGAAATI